MTRASMFLMVFLTAFGAKAAGAWDTTFEPSAVASHLQNAGGLKVLVTAAGGESESTKAATALQKALRALENTSLVMGGESLGAVADLGDEEIVEKAAKMPVEQIFIVRVFPGSGGAPSTAVVTMYDNKGETLGAFSAVAGTVMESGSSDAGQGVSTMAVDQISRVTETNSDAQEEYDRRYLWLSEGLSFMGGTIGNWARIYKGKFKEKIRGPTALYEYIGRNDLAETYRANRNHKIVFGIGTGLITAAGLGLLGWGAGELSYTGSYCSSFDADYLTCEAARQQEEERRHSRGTALAVTGGGVTAIGVVGLLVTLIPKIDPTNMAEKRELIEEFNNNLKAELGLASAEPAVKIPEEPKMAMNLAPYFGRQGGGLVFSLSF